VEEWKRLPLTSSAQMQAWLQEKACIVERWSSPPSSVGKSLTSQETDQRWMGPPLLQPVGQRAQQAVNQGSVIHRRVAHDTEKRVRDADPEMINREGNLQSNQNPSQTRMEPSGAILSEDTWWDHSGPPQLSEGSKAVVGKAGETCGVDVLGDNSYLLRGQNLPVMGAASEQDGMRTIVSPSASHDWGSSISSGLGGQPRDTTRFSSKEWQKYF